MRAIPLSSYPAPDDLEAWLECKLPWGNYTTGAPRGPHELAAIAALGKVRLPGGGTTSGEYSTTGFTVGHRERAAKQILEKGRKETLSKEDINW